MPPRTHSCKIPSSSPAGLMLKYVLKAFMTLFVCHHHTLGLHIAQSSSYFHSLGPKVGTLYILGAPGIESTSEPSSSTAEPRCFKPPSRHRLIRLFGFCLGTLREVTADKGSSLDANAANEKSSGISLPRKRGQARLLGGISGL